MLGLAISYRMSSAYERYAEGRALWARIIIASRTWARLVWIHCALCLSSDNGRPADPYRP